MSDSIDISPMLKIVQSNLESGIEYARKGLGVFAFYEYAKTVGGMEVISALWDEGYVEFTKEDQIRIIAINERLNIAMSRMGNGATNPPYEDSEGEFQAVINHARKEVSGMFR